MRYAGWLPYALCAEQCAMMNKRRLQGFTLVEMIVVIVITGIIGGVVAIFLRSPVQGFVDSARRAEMTDIADTALRRISRDLHLALPNSVRRSGSCSGTTTCYLEFIPTTGGGRYRDASDGTGGGNVLDFSPVISTKFDVLGGAAAMPPVVAGDQIVVYNMGVGVTGQDAYAGNSSALHNRRAVSSVAGNTISITSAAALPLSSCVYDNATGYVIGGCRFQVVKTPVTYVCDPVAGTLARWQGYAIAPGQPTVLPAGGTSSILATSVSSCSFIYDTNVVAQRTGLVTTYLTISQPVAGEATERVTLYAATHVNNVP